ncbi:ABC transporter ATP-binding protein [Lederbergia wuyishanensis]|uniref:Energy-coupling factor transport system ATP-binding protein n=1 Tax=Lederbergia wuyishanensis TaxID=1347903 RepID=A0ABU0D5U7_9BACI|nr:ABC transporter ATP-binding protein [Lederbergia wuyishanensis]MCJ8008373.1 energy-coupling factor ABC transporter ATP-binding protein [Lederbergia wuyishanensis]MDQ0343787.1 energy-coupling factor transport system ATP-binding protein [Lederbergia wuyishanensis]
MTGLLEVCNFSFSYDESEPPILNDISFSLEKGENLLLMGPSGSGKSSLALCVNGLFPRSIDGISTGDIYILGKKIEEYLPGEVNQYVGVVFQDPETQFCMLTVEDEIAFGLENINLPRGEMAERVKWAARLMGIESYLSVNIATLSGGLKQKVALACVLAMKPRLIILDEPISFLDPLSTKDFAKTIQRLQKELQFSLIVIEHKLDHWINFIDRCLILSNNGEIMFDGDSQSCFRSHLKQLKELGIWLPQTFLYKEQFLTSHKIPFTVEELIEILDEVPVIIEKLTPPKEIILEAKNISFSRKKKSILRDININIPKGILTAIVGPNGAGKTTLSYLLCGLEKPAYGEVLLQNRKLTAYRELELSKNIGYVFQNPEHQFITESVYSEVAFSLKVQGMDEKRMDEIIEGVLYSFRLKHVEHHHPFSLSQGQKRRLSVATMLVDEQSFIILDEPTYGQDAKTTKELMIMLERRLHSGTSALMITHDMELVDSYADYVIVLVDGEISFQGTPYQLFSGPKEVLEKAQLELPLRYEVSKQWKLRGEYFATSIY